MFVVFEGPSGGGKNTQIELLAKALGDRGHRVETVSMLDSTELGKAVRALKQGVEHGSFGHRPEALLYFSAIAAAIESLIRPAIRKGSIVLADRYIYTTLAYQGYGGKEDTRRMSNVAMYAVRGLEPDLVVYLDIPVKQGLSRHPKGSHTNQIDFRERVRQGYLEMARRQLVPEWLVVDASKPAEEIHQLILERTLHTLTLSNPTIP